MANLTKIRERLIARPCVIPRDVGVFYAHEVAYYISHTHCLLLRQYTKRLRALIETD